MTTWIALLSIALALGAVAAVASSRRLRALRDALFEDALPSARTGESLRGEPLPVRPADPASDRGVWGLRWVEVTNLTPTGPDRRPGAAPVPSESRDTTVAKS